jgi:hypothetical protein
MEEVATGKTFETAISLAEEEEMRMLRRKDGWFFDWEKESRESGHLVYKLTLHGDRRIQGLISIEPVPGQLYIEMHLIENAPHNRGDGKWFTGVAANLVAFACKMSFDMGFNGFVAFTAKTTLVNHYIEMLGAQIIYNRNRMGIFTMAAKKLVNSYYKHYFHDG